KTDPPWEQLPADTPPRIDRLLRRCLERNPKERLRDIGDARLLLGEVMEGRFPEKPAAGDGTAAAAPVARSRPWLVPAAMIASAVIAGAAVWMLRPAPQKPPLRKFALTHPPASSPIDLAIAPDGSALAFVRDGALHVQDFGEVEDRELVSGDDLYRPFWSPDAEWIAYGADRALWKIRRTGGAPVRLAPLAPPERLTSVAGGAWGEDGRLVFASGSEGLWEVSAQGGDVSVLATPEGDINDFHDVGALPGNAGWLVVLHGPDAFDTIAVLLPDGSRRDLVHVPGEALFLPQWSATGHVVFARGGSARGVYAVPVKAGDWTAAGEPFLIAAGYAHPSLSREGTLAMTRGVGGNDRVLSLVDREGTVLRTFEPAGHWGRWPTLSRDGKQILAELQDGENRDLWLIDTERGSRQRFTDDEGTDWWGDWSADGSEILYNNGDGASGMIRARPASGAGEPRDLFAAIEGVQSPDGRWFFGTRVDTSGTGSDQDIWLIPADAGLGEPRPLVETTAQDRVPFPSPSGEPFVAYVSNRSGREEIYLTTYPDVRGHWPVSIGGGEEPRWRGDGRELFYSQGDSVMVVDVESAGGSPKLGPPRLLFLRPDATRLRPGAAYSAHPSADGQTFAISMQPETTSEDPVSIVVVQNWFREFREN
ncbi:MAG TPA: hypothetical protein VKU85_18545, partial [bacterium]|nr:hypothetical protein [bacterium]